MIPRIPYLFKTPHPVSGLLGYCANLKHRWNGVLIFRSWALFENKKKHDFKVIETSFTLFK